MAALINFTVVGTILLILKLIKTDRTDENIHILTVQIPDLAHYNDRFDQVFKKYTQSVKLLQMKFMESSQTYELKYEIIFKENSIPMGFINDLARVDGVLNLKCGKFDNEDQELVYTD